MGNLQKNLNIISQPTPIYRQTPYFVLLPFPHFHQFLKDRTPLYDDGGGRSKYELKQVYFEKLWPNLHVADFHQSSALHANDTYLYRHICKLDWEGNLFDIFVESIAFRIKTLIIIPSIRSSMKLVCITVTWGQAYILTKHRQLNSKNL